MSAIDQTDMVIPEAATGGSSKKKSGVGITAVIALLAAPLVLVLALATVFRGVMPTQNIAPPSTYAQKMIPADMLALYRSPVVQNECPGLSWTIVAAIVHLESNDGRNVAVSSAGALGPSQFMPTTWDSQGRTVIAFTDGKGNPVPFGRVPDGRGYAMDGNGDGIADINNAYDSVPATARFLCANGGGNPATLYQAILVYNHARWYVAGGIDDNGNRFIGVLPLAKKLAAAFDGTAAPSGLTGPGGLAAGATAQQLAEAILLNHNVIPDGRLTYFDLVQQANGGLPSAGIPLHADLLAVLSYIGLRFQIHISALESGGTGHTDGSAHYGGWAADISVINGTPTSGRDTGALALLYYIMPVLPFGSGIGQSQCGLSIPLSGNVTEFPDTCNHLHLQIP